MGRPGVRDLLARMVRWRVPARWWLVAVSPALFFGLALAAMAAAGGRLPRAADFGQFSGIPAIGLAGVLLLIFDWRCGREVPAGGATPAAVTAPVHPAGQFADPSGGVVRLASAAILGVGTYRDFAPVQYVACSAFAPGPRFLAGSSRGRASDRRPGHGCGLGIRQASPVTITPTTANTASSGSNPSQASSAASKQPDQPRRPSTAHGHASARAHCHHPASRNRPRRPARPAVGPVPASQ